MMSAFLLTIPVLLETTNQPEKLVHQWRRMYLNAHRRSPAIAVTTGLMYGYAAWSKHAAGEPWCVFAAAALTTVGIVPYTLTFMQSINDALFRADHLAAKGTGLALGEVQRMLIRWGQLSAVRALIPLAGGVMGLLGTCGILVL
jgi:noranthrone monooxygenase